jgi:transporter family protein
MWLLLSFISAFLLGCYDVSKKKALDNNAVIPVLFANILISGIIFLPFIILSCSTDMLNDTLFYVPKVSLSTHVKIMLKSLIVLSSWIAGYYSVKNLPLTITGPIKATQPVVTLLGALAIYGERLNLLQWTGVFMSIFSFYLLSSSGKREGIHFTHNKWILYAVLSVILGAISGLYDKYLMKSLDVMTVQVWFCVYQLFMMLPVFFLLWYPHREKTTPFRWRWSIVLISVFLAMADWIYFYALGFDGSMISIVSMIRRSSVVVTFIAGALFLREKNLKSKIFDLILILLGMLFLYLGTR